MPSCHCCRRWIVTLTRKTWVMLIRVVLILIIATLVCLIAFYFCIYQQSLKEALFTNAINCTIGDSKNSSRTCNQQEQRTCQLVFGRCPISGELKNITLYSTWLDYEASSRQCTTDPCSNVASEQPYVNQTLSFVYWSEESTHGYLKRISKLECHVARIILILLAVLLALSVLLAMALFLVLNSYNKWERRIFPVNASNPNPSVYSRPPTFVVQKPSQPTRNKPNGRPSYVESSTSLQRLAVPSDTLLPAAFEYHPRESLWKRTLQPLQISTLSGVVATLRQQQRNAAVTQDTTV